MSEEGWKRFGLIKGPGLPAPSGQYTVGCVDLMHKLEGDNDGLLVRLFYPTTPQIQAEGAARYQYAKWMPDKRYVKASLARTGSRFPGLMSTVTSLILGKLVSCPASLLHTEKDKEAGHETNSRYDTK